MHWGKRAAILVGTLKFNAFVLVAQNFGTQFWLDSLVSTFMTAAE
jgi:hypothetical protein